MNNWLDSPRAARAFRRALVAGTLLVCGCGYLGDRGEDLAEILSLGISDGGGVAVRVAPTRLVTAEVGGRRDETFYGIRRLEGHWLESSWGIPLSFFWSPRLGNEPYREWLWSDILKTSHSKLAFPDLSKPEGSRVASVEERHYHGFVLTGARDTRLVDLFDVEVNGTALILGAQVIVSPGELVDFLAGFFTLDPAGDDGPSADGTGRDPTDEAPPSE